MKTVYIAHPLSSPDRSANLTLAARWCEWAARQGFAPVATWIVLASQWDESPPLRALGLAIDCALVERCDELWLCGAHVSPGMQIEANAARNARVLTLDLTGCPEPPAQASLEFIDRARRDAISALGDL